MKRKNLYIGRVITINTQRIQTKSQDRVTVCGLYDHVVMLDTGLFKVSATYDDLKHKRPIVLYG